MLDDVIDRLLEVRAGRPGRQVQLTEQEVKQLCLTAKDIFMSQPNLLELEAPIKICGKHNQLFTEHPAVGYLSVDVPVNNGCVLQETFMGSIQTCCACSNMGDFPQKRITSFLVTMSTGESRVSKQYACFWRTRYI